MSSWIPNALPAAPAPWYSSRFTGLFTQLGPVPPRPHDPDVALASGLLPPWQPGQPPLAVGGAGWDAGAAEAACVGEAIERCQPFPLPTDQIVVASWQDWPSDEPAVAPHRWVLFHDEQYARPGFPFAPFTPETVCGWVSCRQAGTGMPWWAPLDFVYPGRRPGAHPSLCPGLSTGLSCGRRGAPVLLRGLQEVIERDAVLGAWWGRYGLEEWPAAAVLDSLDASLPPRLLRPNLRYRCYRVRSPFSAHVTLATLEGEDHEGYCFSVGSACRETRTASWSKALREAVQGRHYVRYLKARPDVRLPAAPADFPDHAVWYSVHPHRLAETVLEHAEPPAADDAAAAEDLTVLAGRLGPERPVLFRNLTPPGLAAEVRDWYVLRVLVPGLQPLHGNDSWPHLGGPLWEPRGLAEWEQVPPHPFP